MPPLTSAGAFTRPAARKRASALQKSASKPASPKSALRKKRAPAKPVPRTNSAHDKPVRKKPAAPRRKLSARKIAAPKLSPRASQRVTPFGVITVRSGRPLAYSAELKAHARHRFEETPESAYSIAADLGMHHVSLKRLAKREGWVRRNPPPVREISGVMRLAQEVEALVHGTEAPPAPDPSPPLAPLAGGGERTEPAAPSTEAATPISPSNVSTAASTPPSLDNATIDRLEAAVLKELAVVERQRAALGPEPLRPFDANIIARTLSSLTETLSKLRRLRLAAQPQPDVTHDDMPADIDEFRNELARRIRAFVASRTGGGGTDGDRAAVVDGPQP